MAQRFLDLDKYDFDEFAEDEYDPDELAEEFITTPNNWEHDCYTHTPGGEWVCSRSAGHQGLHVATDGSNDGGGKVYAVWRQGRTSWPDQ